MLRLKREQRKMFADKLPDAANSALGAMFFGQFLQADFSPAVAAVGLVLWALFMAVAARVAGGVR